MNATHETPWRVAEVWSSSTPGEKVRWLADGATEIARVEKHQSFIRWLGASEAAPAAATPSTHVVVPREAMVEYRRLLLREIDPSSVARVLLADAVMVMLSHDCSPAAPAVAGVPDLSAIDAAFEAEIQRVSSLEYNSNEICRHFYAQMRSRIAAAPSAPMTAAEIVAKWPAWKRDYKLVPGQAAPSAQALVLHTGHRETLRKHIEISEREDWSGEAADLREILSAGSVAAPSAPADPCPGCERGGVCKTPECGRLRSSELMGMYGTPPAAPSAQEGKAEDSATAEAYKWAFLHLKGRCAAHGINVDAYGYDDEIRFRIASPAPVATEAVAQGGGVDVEVLRSFLSGVLNTGRTLGRLHSGKSYDEESDAWATDYSEKLRALLTAPPAKDSQTEKGHDE